MTQMTQMPVPLGLATATRGSSHLCHLGNLWTLLCLIGLPLLLSAAPAAAFCPGDCSGDDQVWVEELLRGVSIALGEGNPASCVNGDADGDGAVTIDELTRALGLALDGCTVADLVFRGVARTPDERFAALPDYPFAPRYRQIGPLRVHYLDEGPPQAAPILLLHGEPSWSYLYRHVIPPLVAAGHRVVVPDLVGFGRSDKPLEPAEYTYQRMVDWTAALIAQLDLRGVTLVLHDWGGLIGLRLAAADPDRYDRILVANTGLPTGDEPLNEALALFRDVAQTIPVLPVGVFVQAGTVRRLSAAELAAYDAPFADEPSKVAARRLAALIPATPDDPAAAANRAARAALEQWERPFRTAFSDGDPLTRGGEGYFQTAIPGAADQPHRTIAGAGHFLQEDAAAAFADAVLDFVAAP